MTTNGATFFEKPSSTILSPPADSKSKVVADKVAEVFAEELEEAKRRNTVLEEDN